MTKRFDIHVHSEYSNIRLLDSINHIEDLAKKAMQIGLSGFALTDHDALCGHVKANKLQKQLQKENPDFKIALGNEIYLCDTREKSQKYYHFILIAKDEIGHKQLRQLSSRAWMNSYHHVMERVVTLKSDMEEIVGANPGHLIASTACLGGELSSTILKLIEENKKQNQAEVANLNNHIVEFITWCVNLFHDDFYCEIAPGCSTEQIAVNKVIVNIANTFNIKMIIGSDAHYLNKEDRFVHKAYLNSKGGERETDLFYEYAYMQSDEEVIENLTKSDYLRSFIDKLFENSAEIYNKIKNYDLYYPQQIPKVPVKEYNKTIWWDKDISDVLDLYPTLKSMFTSEDIVERYWINECWLALMKKFNFKQYRSVLTKVDYVKELEEEARVKRVIGDKLSTNMFMYPIALRYYIDLVWECGSTVGAGRGSACAALNHYLLGITQLDPIEWNLPFFRYMNDERTELGDIDIDIAPSKRPIFLNEVKSRRAELFIDGLDELSKANLGATNVATFGTESTKSAILTSCRGYRSEEYPDGIDSDIAQYLSSLIPTERGFVWDLKTVVYGDESKGRKPVTTFINEVARYPRLLDIMFSIEGMVKSRGIHASGIIFFDEDPYRFGCFMRSPRGDIETQYDLHDAEYVGMTKMDILVTDIQDKLTCGIELLKDNNEIDSNLTLREAYDKYLHPNVLPINDLEYWKTVQSGKVLNFFQFETEIGAQALKKIQPKSMMELSDANGLLRLMPEDKGAETPLDKYVRFKSDISLWYDEMTENGLTENEQKALEPYFKSSYGVPPSQEQLMTMLMDKDICNFKLSEANAARKIVGKKQMTKIPELREKVLNQAKSQALGQYVWKYGAGPQMGYSFSTIHALSYSFVGFQSVYIATRWNPIYWNTACLIVNSGALTEDDDSSTDYAKLAAAIGQITEHGQKVSLIDINESSFTFKPNVVRNEILFGMKALKKVNGDSIKKIIENRPYYNIKDFMARCPLNATTMISLIKSGAFDRVDKEWAASISPTIPTRIITMAYYLSKISKPKSKMTLQNFNGMIQRGMVPTKFRKQVEIFLFNKYLKKFVWQDYYVFDEQAYRFYCMYYSQDKLDIIQNCPVIKQKEWDSIYKEEMDKIRYWLTENQQEVLSEFNGLLFKEMWDKYATGKIFKYILSAWEMDSMCFYYDHHELESVDRNAYGISNFLDLPSVPEVDYYYKRGDNRIPIYKLSRIIGTVLSKNDIRSSITLSTPEGVVTVKFTKEYYAMFKRQISQVQADGSKKVVEKSWFTRGEHLMIQGFRRDDTFVAKNYKNSGGHQLYKITSLTEDGKYIGLTHERAEGDRYE